MTESLRRFIEGLDRAKPFLTTEQQTLAPGVKDIADMLWLAAEMAVHTPPAEMETVAVEEPIATESPDSIPPTPEVTSTSLSTITPPPNTESLGILSTQPPTSTPQQEESPESRETTPPLPKKVDRLKVPAAAALRHPLRLIRALRPLARKVDSRTEKIIDEEATAIAIAEKNPIGVVQQPAQERWLSLELVIEQSRITALWDRTSKEWADLLSGSGLFRSVRVWTLGRSEQPDSEQSISEETSLRLASGLPSSQPSRWATPKELLDLSGQSLVMVLSDCVSPRWWQGQIQPVLAEWSSQGPVVVVQWFPPEPYWDRTALKLGYDLQLKALEPGLPNSLLLREYQGLNPEMGLDLLEEDEPTKAVILPIVSLEPHQLEQWSRMVAGYSDAQVTGRRFDLIWQGEQWQGPRKSPRNLPHSGQERVKLFWQTASALAQELAGLMSLGPVSPEITHLIQETLLPQSSPVHVAEVFLSGLLEPTAQGSYAFVPEAKDNLQTSMIEADEQLVFQVLSRYVSERYGRTPREFEVFLQKHSDWSEQEWQQVEGFAELRQRLTTPPTPEDPPIQKPTASGTPSADDDRFSITGQISDEPPLPATSLEERFSAIGFEPDEITDREWPPLLTDFPVGMATVQVEEIVQYEFETATIAQDPESAEWVITKATGTAWGYIELLAEPSIKTEPELDLDVLQSEVYAQGETYAQSEQDRFLSQTIPLYMVEITGGTFTMGSPKDEPESDDDERPQHEVTLQDFAIGQTPVTQAQWRVVAGYSPVNLEVEFKENPSNFEGDDRPVEQISWHEAKEFCDRLSAATGKAYDLPTEAEWEYACRAGTTTPFSFGEMITTELANYDGNYPYNGAAKGEYRRQTTPVGTFPANAWGLYDMHGNLREWCLDHWHDSYEEKPEDLKKDGNTSWLSSDEAKSRLLRGGSWGDNAGICRSAFRYYFIPGIRSDYGGFRVVCRSPRTR